MPLLHVSQILTHWGSSNIYLALINDFAILSLTSGSVNSNMAFLEDAHDLAVVLSKAKVFCRGTVWGQWG